MKSLFHRFWKSLVLLFVICTTCGNVILVEQQTRCRLIQTLTIFFIKREESTSSVDFSLSKHGKKKEKLFWYLQLNS